MIASRLGQSGLAKERLQAALSINPHFHVIYSGAARQQLKLLENPGCADGKPRTESCSVSDSFSSLLALVLLLGPRGFAHPMGNFSVNHYSKISFERDGVRVTYIIDLAEIPTYQELQQGNVTANVADPAVTHFVDIARRGIGTRP